jgi:putative serine protease PepD
MVGRIDLVNNGDATPPPYPQGYALSPPPARPLRGGRVVGAALLVGALAGGAAGFSGAALLHETTSHNAATLSQQSTSGLNVVPDTSGTASPNASDASAETAAANVLPSVVKIYGTSSTQSGSGSGIVLTADGQILTNNHVAELGLSGKLAVSFPNGETTSATILGRDPLTDLAVIQAKDISDATPATLGKSSSLQVGQPVVAVGAPFGLESTVTSGIVSALNRPVTTQGELADDPSTIFPAIQTDAAINPGNSGGPLVNSSGQVVGINSAIRTASDSSSGGQAGSIGLGFAIPIDEAIPIVQQLRNHQQPTHARIGVEVFDATDKFGLPDGALVKTVSPGTAASRIGLKAGDVITKINDTQVADSDSLVADVRSYRPGDRVTLTVRATSGATRTVDVTLGSD